MRPICAAHWGLLGYVIYLDMGSRPLFVPLAFAYGLFAASLIARFEWMTPPGFEESGVGVQLEFARQLSDAGQVVMGLLIRLPIVVAAVGSRAHRRCRDGGITTGMLRRIFGRKPPLAIADHDTANDAFVKRVCDLV